MNTQTQTAHETIYTRASENLEALRNQHAAISAQLDQAQTEHQAAAIAAQSSTEQYQTSLPRLQSLEHAWRVANHYAMLAEDVDPDGETKRSADQLAEQVKVASAERDQLLRKANADSAHEQQLTAQIARLQGELTTITDQLAQGKGVHDTAHAALGIARHSEALAAYSERQARIDALKAELSKLEAERDLDLDERSKGLLDWHDHHSFVRALRQPEDATLKVIRAELAYIQSLIDARRELPKDLNIKSLLKAPYHYGASWWKQLQISHDEIQGINGLSSDAIALRNHLAIMQEIESEYSQWLQEQPAQ